MEDISIRLNELMKNDFFRMLLKNDVVIYGKFLRQHFFENMSLEEYSKLQYTNGDMDCPKTLLNIFNCHHVTSLVNAD